MKHFYSHIIEIESITIELDQMELSESEKMHLASLIDSNLHHSILAAVLSELSDRDKKTFMMHLIDQDNDKIWDLLNEKVEKLDIKIKEVAEEIKKELHEDIRMSQKLKSPDSAKATTGK